MTQEIHSDTDAWVKEVAMQQIALAYARGDAPKATDIMAELAQEGIPLTKEDGENIVTRLRGGRRPQRLRFNS